MMHEPSSDKPDRKPLDQSVQNAPEPHHDLPGKRAAWPPGTLSTPYFGPQGDENRDPPPNAPTPTAAKPATPANVTSWRSRKRDLA